MKCMQQSHYIEYKKGWSLNSPNPCKTRSLITFQRSRAPVLKKGQISIVSCHTLFIKINLWYSTTRYKFQTTFFSLGFSITFVCVFSYNSYYTCYMFIPSCLHWYYLNGISWRPDSKKLFVMYFSTSYFCPLLKSVPNTLLSTPSQKFRVSARLFSFTTV